MKWSNTLFSSSLILLLGVFFSDKPNVSFWFMVFATIFFSLGVIGYWLEDIADAIRKRK